MNDEQREKYLVPILRGMLWCQLMSEPGAGSDIGGITTRAERDTGEEWVINGQKVWTTAATVRLRDLPHPHRLGRPEVLRPDDVVPMYTPRVAASLAGITGEAEFWLDGP